MNRNGEDRERASSLLVHHLLGQLGEDDERWLEAQLRDSAELRAEREELARTVRSLRQARALQPSARFRSALERRLDGLDADRREQARSTPRVVRRRERRVEHWNFRWHLLGHRLRTSPRLRIQLAAGLLPLFVGIGWLLSSAEPAAPVAEPSVARWEPEVEPAEPGGPSLDGVREQQTVADVGSIEPATPVGFEPGEPELEAPETGPLDELPETDRVAEGSPFERPLPIEKPLRDPVQPERPEVPDPSWERPVRRALRWMLAQQLEDGSWSARDGDADLGVAVTAVSVLAFVSDGHLGLRERAEDPLGVDAAVRRGIEALLSRQHDGLFGASRTGDFATETFNHATATLALGEHVSLALAAGAEPAGLERERRAVVEGLDILETRLRRLFRPDPGSTEYTRRGEGVNAAWAAQALASARRSGLDWGLLGLEGQEVEAMFARLGGARSSDDSARAGSLLFQAMTRPLEEEGELDEWSTFVARLLERPDRTEPGMRFLVASALAPWHDGEAESRSGRWEEFRDRLEQGLLKEQHPEAGYFDVPLRGAFDGGAVYDTALCVLTLQVGQRVERLRAAAASR